LLPHKLGEKERAQLSNHLHKTNDAGELVDMWRTPIRFTPVGATNLIIKSAGPNRRLGDKDDIVFNSALITFIKP
jgi:hypothetical protein